jgi:hypothetical protein
MKLVIITQNNKNGHSFILSATAPDIIEHAVATNTT